tara:strand:- start:2005 stop:2346 length:342 start_codon:yes stop_codon:yes gene_type:complete
MCESQYSESWERAREDVFYAHCLAEVNGYDLYWKQHYYSGASISAFTNREVGYNLMIEESLKEEVKLVEYFKERYGTEEEIQEHYDTHHNEAEPEPYWSKCVKNINNHMEFKR